MKQPLSCYAYNPVNSFSTYGVVSGGGRADSSPYYSEANSHQVVSMAGAISDLRVVFPTAPGAGTSWTVTLRVNGADSALTCTVAGTDTVGTDTTHSVDVVPGDLIAYKFVPSATPVTSRVACSAFFTGGTAQESLILGTDSGGTVATAAVRSAPLMNSIQAWSADPDYIYQLISTPGTLKNLYVKLSVDPGTSPDAYRFTIYINGSPSAITVTITADATTGNDTTHTATVSAGDEVYLYCEPLEVPSASPYVNWGCGFVADIDGESLLMFASYSSPLVSPRYAPICTSDTWNTTEAGRLFRPHDCTLKKLYAKNRITLGAGSATFTLMENAGASSLACTITYPAQSANDTVNSVDIDSYNSVTMRCTFAGGANVNMPKFSLVAYIAPTGGEEAYVPKFMGII